jgi:S-adenosylmethionine hydrolase
MIKSKKIGPLYPSYNSVKKGEPVAVIGSKGYLEAAVFCGNASQYFKAKRGDSVRVIFKS